MQIPQSNRVVGWRKLSLGMFLAGLSFLAACGGPFDHGPAYITPGFAVTGLNGTVQFNLAGARSTATSWTVGGIPGGSSVVGTISADGTYQAPSDPPPDGLVNIVVQDGTTLSAVAQAVVKVQVPPPQLTAVSPDIALANGPDLNLVIQGQDFIRISQVQANGTPVPTSFVSSTMLQATIPASLLPKGGSVAITVSTVVPGSGGTSLAQPISVLSGGTVSATNNPQVAKYFLQLPESGNVEIEFGPSTAYGLKTWSRPVPAGGGTVGILVAGMRSFTSYHMRAHVTLPDGSEFWDADQTFTTGGPLAMQLPSLTVSRPNAGTQGGGVELMNVFGLPGQLSAFVTDLDGNVIWYYDVPPGEGLAFPIRPLANGDMLVNLVSNPGDTTPGSNSSGLVREIDLAGNAVREFTLAELQQGLADLGIDWQVTQIHHDVLALPNGHWILLGNIYKNFNDLTGYTGTVTVGGDVIVDIDADNRIVWTWSAFDHLDVNRHPMAFPDWTHSNALIYTADHNLLISMRHQHWIVKLDYQDGKGTGNVLWHLGAEGDFTLDTGNPSDWFYAQHFPVILSNSGSTTQFAVYDNGNLRPDQNGLPCGLTATSTPCYSRGVIMTFDETARTAHLDWAYTPGWYSVWGGSIAVLSNGNVDFDFTNTSNTNDVLQASTIIEAPRDNPSIIWRMDVNSGNAYRGYRIPSLYPGVQW